MSEIKYFTYSEIKDLLLTLINSNVPWRTISLIAFQYASGSRIGELLKYKHEHKVVRKDEDKKTVKDAKGNIVYREWTEESKGLLKSNIKVNEEEGLIEWSMPNFKVKNEKKQTKYPFVFKKEKLLWNILKVWLDGSKKYGVPPCGQQVFKIKESTARSFIKQAILLYAKKSGKFHLKDHASHSIRRSRGTHLVEKFKHDPYEVMDALGHTSLQSGIHYVAIVNRKQKMLKGLSNMETET